MTFLPDNERVYSIWRQLVIANNVRGVQVHDARLAAIMQAYGLTHILTLNQPDFLRYTDIQVDSSQPGSTFNALVWRLCARPTSEWAGTWPVGPARRRLLWPPPRCRIESLGRVVCRSSLYSTEPVGFAAQPRFINAVVALETELEARDLLERLLAIEVEFGRDRAEGFANGPRTLDLDILLFGYLKISEPGLEDSSPAAGRTRLRS